MDSGNRDRDPLVVALRWEREDERGTKQRCYVPVGGVNMPSWRKTLLCLFQVLRWIFRFEVIDTIFYFCGAKRNASEKGRLLAALFGSHSCMFWFVTVLSLFLKSCVSKLASRGSPRRSMYLVCGLLAAGRLVG